MTEDVFVLTEVRRYGPDAGRNYSEAVSEAKELLVLRAEQSRVKPVSQYEVRHVPDVAGGGGEVALCRSYR